MPGAGLAVATLAKLRLVARGATGAPIDATVVQWVSRDATAARIGADGTILPTRAGRVEIGAWVEG